VTEEQQAEKYISGLKYHIQKHVILPDVFSVDEAHNKVLKIDGLQSRAPSFRRSTTIVESASDAGIQPTSTTVD